MSRHQLGADLAAALALAVVVIVVSPGLAVDGIIGCGLLLALAAGAVVRRIRRRRRAREARPLSAAERSAQRRAARAGNGR